MGKTARDSGRRPPRPAPPAYVIKNWGGASPKGRVVGGERRTGAWPSRKGREEARVGVAQLPGARALRGGRSCPWSSAGRRLGVLDPGPARGKRSNPTEHPLPQLQLLNPGSNWGPKSVSAAWFRSLTIKSAQFTSAAHRCPHVGGAL